MLSIVSKTFLRQSYMSLRKSIPDNTRLNLEYKIQNNFRNIIEKIILEFQDIKHHNELIISGYYSKPGAGEVDVLPLLNSTKQYADNIKLSLPVVVSKKTSHMVFKEFSSNRDLEMGKYGIMNPNMNCKIVCPHIMITPLVCFDSELNRIGWGKGFYDRAIASLRKTDPVISIGVAYKIQKTNLTIPVNEFDTPLDIIITEDRVYMNESSSIIKQIYKDKAYLYY